MKVKNQSKSIEPSLSRGLRVGHWLCALAVFYLLVSSWWMLSLPLPSENTTFRVLPFQLHKNIGITLFLLLLVMLCSFIFRGIKAFAAGNFKQKALAQLGHGLMYFLLLFCCVTGYLSSSFSGWGTEFWWLLDLPAWAQENDDLNALFSDMHLWSCWLLLLLIGIHVAAALNHALKNDGVIDSML